LPGYNEFRKICGLPVIRNWEDLKAVMLPDAAKRFPMIYKHPDDIDIFAGGISENHTIFEVGPTFGCLLAKQFTAVRDGDRFYYENPGVFTAHQLNAIRKVKLSTILCNNLQGLVSVQVNAFRTPSEKNFRRGCFTSIPELDLSPWKEQSNQLNDQEDEEPSNIDQDTKMNHSKDFASDKSIAARYEVSNDGPSQEKKLEKKLMNNEENTVEGYHVVSGTDQMDTEGNNDEKNTEGKVSQNHQKKPNHNTIDQHMLKRLASFLGSKQADELWSDVDDVDKQTTNKQEEKELDQLTSDDV